jgi:hypothetical protein
MATRGLQQLPVVPRDRQQAIGLLTPEGITLADSMARTREVLQRHLECKLTAKPEATKDLHSYPIEPLEPRLDHPESAQPDSLETGTPMTHAD